MVKLIDLINEIEHVRNLMIATATEKGLTHPNTLKVSTKLDKLLIVYYRTDKKHRA